MNISPKRAFILDDDRGIRKLINELLHRCGYTVMSYSSPIEATIFRHPENCPMATDHEELFSESQTCAELIITDINMPVISGIEYIRKIRQIGCRVRYIAIISSDWNEAKILEAEAVGCKVFIKPLDIGEMIKWIRSLEA